jgi:hypothetical protein
MDPDFLALNFEAVVLELVPWAYISHKSGVTGEQTGLHVPAAQARPSPSLQHTATRLLSRGE